jgi:membrane protease subunit HflK
VVLAIVLMILISGIRTVKQGEVAVVLRFGKLTGDTAEEQVHEPGLLFAFPYIIDEVITVPVGKVFEVTVDTHYTEGRMGTDVTQNGYCITGDQNIAVVSASVKYTISDPVRYVLGVADAPGLINATVSSAMVNKAANMDVDDLLTTKKDEFAASVLSFAMEKLDSMGAGVTITSVELTQVAVPEAVRETFQSLNAATVQAETILQRAETSAASIRLEAEANANTLKARARTEKTNGISTATLQLSEFWGVIEDMQTTRATIFKDNAAAHGHGEEYDPGVSVCEHCQRLWEPIEAAVYDRLYTEKFNAIIQKIGKLYLTDGESKIFINP